MNMNNDLESLAAWNVETADLTGRVMSAIGRAAPVAELLAELRAMRQDLAELRQSNATLEAEMNRLRSELSGRNARIAPYSPTEGLIRLA
jgi:hypothetical protein